MLLTGKCPKCGCTGIHACMGAPVAPMTAHQLQKLENVIKHIAQSEKERKNTMTLTKEQIKNLAIFAGFHVQDISGSEASTEYVVRDGTITGENGAPDYNGLIAYDREYPEDGAISLD